MNSVITQRPLRTPKNTSQKWYLIEDYSSNESEKKKLYSSATYTDDKNYIKTQTDQANNTTTYNYDTVNGTLSSVTNAAGNTTTYSYDSNNNNLLSVSAGGHTNTYSYNNDRLTGINVNNSTHYAFNYDKFGRTVSTSVGNGTNSVILSALEYDQKGLMTKQTYGNKDYISFAYDSLDRLSEKSYNKEDGSSVAKKQYIYGNDGNISVTVDFASNSYTRYNYDLSGRTASIREYSGTDVSSNIPISYTEYKYADKTSYLTGVKHFSPLGTQNIGYTYGNINNGEMPDQVYSVSWNGVEKVTNKFDSLSRLSKRTVNGLATNYTYKDIEGNQTTTLVNSVETAAGTFTYTYDEVGNIQTVSDGTNTTSYKYDNLNQLVRENNQKLGVTITYAYQNGNITERKEYAYTTGDLGEVLDTKTWTYGNNIWSDLLTNFNGQTITYDEIGNPLTIGSQTLSWNGRQLRQIADGNNTYSYAYNIDGQRVSKTVNGITTEYFYNGSILAGQKTGENTLVLMYDNDGTAFGFTYNGTEYYYLKNAQNDVVALVDSNRQIVAKYAYDAWGRIVSVTDAEGNDISAQKDHIGNVNPIRYRSYYYDNETGLYYLKTRYYSPDMCRFLNADGSIGANQDIHAYNLFAYCSNNPVNFYDPSGCYIITFPAEGDGPVTVSRMPWESEVSIEKVGDTYIATPSSNLPNALGNIAGLTGISIGDELVKTYLDGIYVAQREVTFRTASNIVVRTYVPKHPSLVRAQNYSKTVGVISTIAYVYDMAMNFKTYGGFTKDFAKASVVTSVMTVIGIGIGVGFACLNIPATAGLLLAIGSGLLLSMVEDHWKTSWIGY